VIGGSRKKYLKIPRINIWAWWLMPIILPTQEAEIRRIVV
jgi:hypothetical protein